MYLRGKNLNLIHLYYDSWTVLQTAPLIFKHRSGWPRVPCTPHISWVILQHHSPASVHYYITNSEEKHASCCEHPTPPLCNVGFRSPQRIRVSLPAWGDMLSWPAVLLYTLSQFLFPNISHFNRQKTENSIFIGLVGLLKIFRCDAISMCFLCAFFILFILHNDYW